MGEPYVGAAGAPLRNHPRSVIHVEVARCLVDEQPRVAVTVVVPLLTERVGVPARRAPRRGEHVAGDGPRLTLVV